jgi:hypothetical protein
MRYSKKYLTQRREDAERREFISLKHEFLCVFASRQLLPALLYLLRPCSRPRQEI